MLSPKRSNVFNTTLSPKVYMQFSYCAVPTLDTRVDQTIYFDNGLLVNLKKMVCKFNLNFFCKTDLINPFLWGIDYS